MNDVTFGQWMKAKRRHLGLTQYDLERDSGIARSHLSKIENDGISMPEKATRERLHEVLGTTDDDLVAVGLLTKSVIPDRDGTTRTIYFTPDGRSEEGFVRWNVTTEAGPVPTEPPELPPHMRASFLKAGDLSPERQELLKSMIDTFYEADEAYREQIKRDVARRREEGISD